MERMAHADESSVNSGLPKSIMFRSNLSDVRWEKRHLKARVNRRWLKDGENFSNVRGHPGRMATIDDDAHQGRKGREEFEEKDFRPTSPGHSPGVGHSINN
ncbi:unnamed protein product [Sphenostylis stenocarpa]|uniref:Uncharacterized protein n=1 Tax=Sphenostylis stenocarpa TaxID=92480 RepID=A0AA86RWQ8_9FABA|nr:unnamed protein product [Sphenostylis stenocarpa]